ncbi:MAG: hypothetical protein COA43_01140 [Robiginitomaculum sp.]|nr:MAG: hypothetical protein COA43_01140 [Robiginitomaculum sp.]
MKFDILLNSAPLPVALSVTIFTVLTWAYYSHPVGAQKLAAFVKALLLMVVVCALFFLVLYISLRAILSVPQGEDGHMIVFAPISYAFWLWAGCALALYGLIATFLPGIVNMLKEKPDQSDGENPSL